MDNVAGHFTVLSLCISIWGFGIMMVLKYCTDRIIKAIEKLRKDAK